MKTIERKEKSGASSGDSSAPVAAAKENEERGAGLEEVMAALRVRWFVVQNSEWEQ